MKHYILITLLSATGLLAAVSPVTPPTTTITTQPNSDKELAWVDEQIQAILPTRIGVPDSFINALRDPMKMKKPVPVIKNGSLLPPPKLGSTVSAPKIIEEPLRLLAMMNKSVLINGKWYKVGDHVRAYTLQEIKPNSVLLNGPKDQKLILFLTKQNNNIKIITQ